MMSLQSSMHSSQMYTVGPAMSLRTSFWLFPQNEHFSVPLPSRVRAMRLMLLAYAVSFARGPAALALLLHLRGHGRRLAHRPRRGLGGDDVVDDSIVARLLGGHEKVAIRI